MARKAIYVLLVSLALAVLAPRSEAQLGCVGDVGFEMASCTTAADCAPVGGIDCTGFRCFCDTQDGPFCPCEVAEPAPGVAMAPALSRGGQVGIVALLGAVGILGLWRRRAGSSRDLA